jgi:hypothetical protein
MDSYQAGNTMSRLLALPDCPQTNPACLFPWLLYLDSSVVGQPLKHPLSV